MGVNATFLGYPTSAFNSEVFDCFLDSILFGMKLLMSHPVLFRDDAERQLTVSCLELTERSAV